MKDGEKKPKRSYTTTTLDSSGYIEGGGVRALPHNLWVDIKRNKVLYVCLTLILAFFVIFSFLPLVGLLMAFERYSPVKGFFGSQWVGLQNFETFFSGPYVGRLIRNTLAIGVLNLVHWKRNPTTCRLCLGGTFLLVKRLDYKLL